MSAPQLLADVNKTLTNTLFIFEQYRIPRLGYISITIKIYSTTS